MKILVFGEILYDIYNNIYSIGGAALNYAIHLSRFVNEPLSVLMVSSVGVDNLGFDAIEFAKKEGIDTSFICLDSKLPTGKAEVFLDEYTKIPDYKIHENVAWDNILYSTKLDSVLENEYDVLYCNILSQRGLVSQQTLNKIFEKINVEKKICDITIRKQYYSKKILETTLNYVNILKLNEDELIVIKDLFYPSISELGFNNINLLQLIKNDFSLSHIFLTLGKNGACMLSDVCFMKRNANDVLVVDTVGAGDAFSAAVTYAMLCSASDRQILEFASSVSEEIVMHSGAVPTYDVSHFIESILH